MQRNVLPQHKIACFFVSMPNGLTTIQLYAKLSVHINQASVSYGASVGFLGGNASSLTGKRQFPLQEMTGNYKPLNSSHIEFYR